MRVLLSIFIVSTLVTAARAQELSPSEIKEARKLYIGKCAKCHKLYDPHAYTDAEWDKWLRKMTRKARLSSKQADMLSQYLSGIRAENTSATQNSPR